jgi:pSer/pThr/pTyr-binding forkhead associated (FHA) protein
MALIMVVKEGPRVGDQFRPQSGLSIGRSRGEITLRDPKVSNPHAKIIDGEDGYLYLADEGSSNGIWIGEEKADKICLKPGITIRLGNTLIELVEEAELDLPEEQRDTWRGRLWTYLRSENLEDESRSQIPSAFAQPIRLEFIEGPFMGHFWTIGYGPRIIGSGSPDLFLPDESLPPICFKIEPSKLGPVVESESKGLLYLNDKEISSEKISNGDVIRIGRHAIRVTM